jgi:hypothetical protein
MRMQHQLVLAGQTDVKNPGIRMINPDDGVKVGHVVSLRAICR